MTRKGKQAALPVKKSFGIICVKRGEEGDIETLLVRHRISYAFFDFVTGQFDPTSDEAILRLLSEMSPSEKIKILSFHFPQMWYWIWLSHNQDAPFAARTVDYRRVKTNYEYYFDNPRGRDRLNRLAMEAEAKYITPISDWTPPRGRQNRDETKLECAIREFTEETKYSPSNLFILPEAKRSYSYVDNGVVYHFTYFFALFCPDKAPPVERYRPNYLNHIREISETRWFTLEQISNTVPQLLPFMRPAFRYIKKFMQHK